MGMTNDPDETAVLDLNRAHRKIVTLFGRDGVIDADERQVLSLFDAAKARLGTSYRRRRAFEAWMRNGDNDYTRRLARHADITFVDAGAIVGTVTPLAIAEDTTNERRSEATPNDAA